MSPRANKKYCTVTSPPACLPPSAVVSVGDKEEKEAVVVGTSKEEKGKRSMVSPASWLLKGERKKKEQEVVKSQAKGTGYSSYQNKEGVGCQGLHGSPEGEADPAGVEEKMSAFIWKNSVDNLIF